MSQQQHSSRLSINTERKSRDADKDEEDSRSPESQLEDPEMGNALRNAPTALDWNGPHDPENPLNWPKWKRHYHVVPPALIGFAATIGTSIYTPAVRVIMEDFNVSSTVALLPLSLYVLALAFGPVLAAPMSETYGRHIVYQLSVPFGVFFTIGVGFSQNIASICVLRFFAGLAFSPSLAIGAGTLADVFKPEHRAGPTTLFITSPFLGPALGPVIGSFVTVRKDWRWTQWTLIFFALFAMLSHLLASETYKKTILSRRAKQLNIPAAPSPFPTAAAKYKFLLTVTLIRPIHMLLTEPIVAFLSLYISFNFAILFSFFAAFPYVFESVYHFNTEQSGLVFLAIGTGCMLAVPTVLLCDHFLYQPKVRLSHQEGRMGVVPPEYRLYPAMMGSLGLPIGLFWFAWTARSSISWVAPVVAAVPFSWGNLNIFISSAMYLTDTYQSLTGASAMAANALLRYLFGGVFPLFILQMYARLGIEWATSFFAFVTVLLMPIPWVFFKYGPQIRRKSHYDTTKA